MNPDNRYELLGLESGMVLAAGRLFGPLGYTNLLLALETGSSITVIAPIQNHWFDLRSVYRRMTPQRRSAALRSLPFGNGCGIVEFG